MSAAERTSLAILGAGPGGLTLAEFLRLRGFDGATLIERAARVGGKSDSVDLGDQVAEMGTCYATGAHKDVLAWMNRQKAPFRILRRTTIDGSSLRDYIGTAGGPPLAAQVLAYLGKRDHLLGQLRRTPDKACVLKEAAMPAEAWLRERRLPKMTRLMYRAVTALGYGYLNEVSIYQAMQWVDAHTIISGATGKLIMPARGWTDFWETLSGPYDVRLLREVTRIERGPEGALIHFADGAKLASRALACTIPLDDWNRLVTDPSPDEKSVAAAITWKGYATSLIVVEDWFTSEDIRSFSKAFLLGSHPGQLISARYEGYSPDLGGHLYVTGQIPGDYTPAELRIFLERNLADLGAKLVKVFNARIWRYFPQYDLKALEDGLLTTLMRMQGASHTWYSGASFSHESVANVSRLNKTLAPRLVASLGAEA